jgi:gas vesicle protein
MSDNRSPDEIERDIEHERAQLKDTVDELQDRFSPERLVREATRSLYDHGGDIGDAVMGSVKRNPMALALTGIGLAWMMSGRSWDETPGVETARKALPKPRTESRTSYPAATRTAEPRPRTMPTTDYDRLEDRGLRDSSEDWLYADDEYYWEGENNYEDSEGGSSYGDRASHAARSAGQSISDAGRSVNDGLHSAAGKAGSAASSAGQGVADAGRSMGESISGAAASVRDRASAAGTATAERAQRIRERLAHGTEELTEEARERIVAARWAAVKARRAASRRLREGGDMATEFFRENPLVVGGLALAAGALIAGALPRTRQEDAYFGEQSDDAYDRAERIYQAERKKAMKVANKAAETAGDVIREEREKIDGSAPGEKSAAEHAADELRDGVERVRDSAKSEAEKQKLGKPES